MTILHNVNKLSLSLSLRLSVCVCMFVYPIPSDPFVGFPETLSLSDCLRNIVSPFLWKSTSFLPPARPQKKPAIQATTPPPFLPRSQQQQQQQQLSYTRYFGLKTTSPISFLRPRRELNILNNTNQMCAYCLYYLHKCLCLVVYPCCRVQTGPKVYSLMSWYKIPTILRTGISMD